jgi:hypothetical protein
MALTTAGSGDITPEGTSGRLVETIFRPPHVT